MQSLDLEVSIVLHHYTNQKPDDGYKDKEGEEIEGEFKSEEEMYKEISKALEVIPDWIIEELYGSYGFELTITKDSIEKDDYDCGY